MDSFATPKESTKEIEDIESDQIAHEYVDK